MAGSFKESTFLSLAVVSHFLSILEPSRMWRERSRALRKEETSNRAYNSERLWRSETGFKAQCVYMASKPVRQCFSFYIPV